MRTPLFGSHYQGRSLNLADNQSINLYPELVETKDGKDVGALYSTPGLDLLTQLAAAPVRGLHTFDGGGVLYAVAGNTIYSISGNWTATSVGTINSASGPVQMIDDGVNILVVDGNNGHVVAPGPAVSLLTLPFANPTTATYQDGFGLVSFNGLQQFAQSNLKDLTTWSALNFSSADAKTDNIMCVKSLKREIWVVKETNTEIWIDGGLSGFAFERLDGPFIEQGTIAPYSVAKSGESLLWLAQNTQGQNMILETSGYQVKRISTHSLENILNGYNVVSDAIAYVYQQGGHQFYVITFPSANATWAYDITTSEMSKLPLWHQRAYFSNGVLGRHLGNCYAFFNGTHVLGDYINGNLYRYNLSTLTDNGQTRKWVRTWRALQKPAEAPTSFRSLRIDMQTGMGVPDGTNPQCQLRWSDDGGHNWSNPRFAAVGPTGATAQRVKFNRLGSTRRNSGLDRIFELSSTDQFNVALMGAELQ